MYSYIVETTRDGVLMNGQNVYTSNVVYNDIRCKLKHDCTGGVIQKCFTTIVTMII